MYNTVPGRFYSTLWYWLKHLLIAIFAPILWLCGYEVTAEQLMIDSTRHLLVGYSCRSLFDIILSEMKARSDTPRLQGVCTPFLHTGFHRIIDWQGVDSTYLDLDINYRIIADEDKLRHRSFLLITHVFGNPFDVDALIKTFRNLNPNGVIIEDCVQAGIFNGTPTWNRSSDIVLFSCGQDKIPVAFGGGFGLFIKAEYRDRIKFIVDMLPADNYFSRVIIVAKKLLTLIVYNSKWLISLIKALLHAYGYSPSRFALKYRKNISGFVHEREQYLKRPSQGQLISIWVAFERSYTEEAIRSRSVRRMLMDLYPEYFPWKDNLQNTMSSNFYTHVYVPDKETFLQKMEDRGAIVLDQQSWYVNQEQSPTAYDILQHIMMLPSLDMLNNDEITALLS